MVNFRGRSLFSLEKVRLVETSGMPEKASSVFLSYARSDRKLVQKIGKHLREAGLGISDPDESILPVQTGRHSCRQVWILDSLPSVRYEIPSKTGKQIIQLLSQSYDVPEAKACTH